MTSEGADSRRPPGLSEAAVWRRSRTTDAADDEAERFLDLAGFVDGQLDPDEHERVADLLARDPAAAADVTAAREVAVAFGNAAAPPGSVVDRAVSLVGPPERRGVVLRFAPRSAAPPQLRRIAGWASLAAAMVIASWLGFALGVDTSVSLAQVGQAGDDGFLRELLDPSAGFLRDLDGGTQT